MSGDRPAPAAEAKVLVDLAEKITTGDHTKSEFKAATEKFGQEWASVVKDPAYLAQVKIEAEKYAHDSWSPLVPNVSFYDNNINSLDSQGKPVGETTFASGIMSNSIGSMSGSNDNMLRAWDNGEVDVLLGKAGVLGTTGEKQVTDREGKLVE
jgi:hypothetical protein